MRVLQLGKFYPIHGGVEKVMYDVMLGMSERGLDCDMLCAGEEGKSHTIVLSEHARLFCRHTWKKAYATMLAPSMITFLRRHCREYDIIHVHHPDPMACVALLLSGYKGKVVLHWHADIEKQKMLLRFYRPLQRWLSKRADVIIGTTPIYIAGSPFLKKVQDKTVCLPIGVDPLCPDEAKIEEIRKRYPGRKLIFTLGRLVGYKGYEYLIEAARYLTDDYLILIGGRGPLKDSLTAQIKAQGVENRVMLLGKISDEELPAYYGACDVFCLSSVQRTEAFGIVQIEAMSCGKPLVATRIPQSGVAWVNEDGVSGLNVEPRDAKALAEAIRTITSDEELYHKLSEGAEERFKRIFTRDKMMRDLITIYKKLCKTQD